jgi:ligand-binding sensor domain-containing protein
MTILCRGNWRAWWLLGLLLWVAGQGVQAQDTPPGEFRFEHITVDQGLSHSDAMCMAQDHDGFIWIGTNRGIDRYDGYQLKSYALAINPRNGQSGNRIAALLAAPNGQLWVGAENSGLSRYDAAHDTFVPLGTQPFPAAYRTLANRLAQADVKALATDAQGRLWVGTAQQGLFVVSFTPQGQPLALRHLPAVAAGQPPLVGITGLVIDADGQAWVGTMSAGLVLVRTTEPTLPVEATPLTLPVSALTLDRRGDLWVGTERQLFWVPTASRRLGHALAAQALPHHYPRIQALHLDSFGRLWAGTLYGLYVWEAGLATGTAPPLRATRPTLFLPRDGEMHGLNSERVHQIFEGHDQLVWLCASAGGLNKVDLRQRAFGHLRHQLTGQPALSNANNYINAIYKEEATNTLWLGSRNGVSAYDLARHTYRSYLNQQSDTVRGVDVATIFRTTDGTLWFGTRDNGLVALRRTDGREQLTTYRRLPGGYDLATTSIEHLAQDGQGTLWVATFSQGLFRLSTDGQLLAHYDAPHAGLPTSRFTYLLYDARRDVLWASTRDAGLLKLRPTADSLRLLRQFAYDVRSSAANGLRVNYVAAAAGKKRRFVAGYHRGRAAPAQHGCAGARRGAPLQPLPARERRGGPAGRRGRQHLGGWHGPLPLHAAHPPLPALRRGRWPPEQRLQDWGRRPRGRWYAVFRGHQWHQLLPALGHSGQSHAAAGAAHGPARGQPAGARGPALQWPRALDAGAEPAPKGDYSGRGK